jgi:hypothetical protein
MNAFIDWGSGKFNLVSPDIEVLVNGKPLSDVALLCFDEGWAEQYVVSSENGLYVTILDGEGVLQPTRRRVHGEIEIRRKLPEGSWPQYSLGSCLVRMQKEKDVHVACCRSILLHPSPVTQPAIRVIVLEAFFHYPVGVIAEIKRSDFFPGVMPEQVIEAFRKQARASGTSYGISLPSKISRTSRIS